MGLIKTETDIHGNVTSYTYDIKGNVLTSTQVINGTSYTTTSEYNNLGWLTQTIDPNGISTEYIYDDSGNILLTRIKDSSGENIQITRTVYDSLGRTIQEIGPEEYNALSDNLDTGIYTETTVGTRTVYNEKGQVASEVDNLGNTTSYVYDNDGNIIKEIQPNGSYTEYQYDKDKRKIKESFYDHTTGQTTVLEEITYSETINQVTIKRYLRGNLYVTTIEKYNWEGMLVEEISPNNRIQTNTYDKGLLIREDDGCGGWTEYIYDAWGRVLTETSAFDSTGNSVTKNIYDNYGNVVCELVKNNASGQQESYSKKSYEYDSQGNCIKEIYYDGDEPSRYIQKFYDWDGKLLREYKGLSSPITINGLDNVINSSDLEYSVIKYEYDTMRRLSKKTDALGKFETYEYDDENREIKRIDRNGIIHTTEYDKNGNEVKKVSGEITKKYTYDCMGNVLTETEDNITTTYTYDGRENCLTETTGNIIKTYTYDNVGMQLSSIIQVGDVQVQRVLKVYDRMSRLLWVYENGNKVATYTYDLLGRLIKTENTNGTTEVNTYNLAGLVTSTINKKGSEILSQYVYTYYFDGKERSKTDIDGSSYYIYDGNNQLLKEVRNTISNNTTMENAVSISVDSPVNVDISETNQMRYYKFIPGTTSTYYIESKYNSNDPDVYLYSVDGQLISQYDDYDSENFNFGLSMTLTAGMTYIIGVKEKTGLGNCTFVVTQVSDDNIEIDEAKMIDTEYLINVIFDDIYQMRYFSFVAKKTGKYTISSRGNSGAPANCILYNVQGSILSNSISTTQSKNFQIEYDLIEGNAYIIGVNLYAGTGEYIIDIISPNIGINATEYYYDANGNRTKLKDIENGNITETVYTYDKNDRLLTKQVGADVSVSYIYDDNGNMLSNTNGIVQTFDKLNRMITYKSNDGTITVYNYYPDDLRMSKTVGTSDTTTQIWLNDKVAIDLNGSNVVSSYIYGEKLIKGAYGWYLYNAHGDVVALTNNDGTITKNYEYNPFGVQLSDKDTIDLNPYRYCGEYYDAESGYTYLQARYYEPEIGRFISEDPAFDGNNWYVYCGNDPINMIDPTGMWSKKIHKRISTIAYNRVITSFIINKKIKRKDALKQIKNGSVYPDTARKDGISEYRKGKWHGHESFRSVTKVQFNLAVSTWKKKKYKQAYFEIGKAMHAIQDYYAHNVVLNGKVVNSRRVADGTFYINNLGKLQVEEHPQYFDDAFLKRCWDSKRIIIYKTGVHSLTADNPYAHFDGKKWVWGEKHNYRYNSAIDKSEEYLINFTKLIKNK